MGKSWSNEEEIIMNITRRSAVGMLGAVGALPLLRSQAQQEVDVQIASGPFQAAGDSLQAYKTPDWFRNAKFGIWSHWGPQSVPEKGDWYARNMYIEGSAQYKSHLETYGHPSKFGFKDIIPTFKAENFDPDYLVRLYRKAGAR
jgi:alpha-L-fucosidase